jgi:hypothetical protein
MLGPLKEHIWLRGKLKAYKRNLFVYEVRLGPMQETYLTTK